MREQEEEIRTRMQRLTKHRPLMLLLQGKAPHTAHGCL